MDPLYDRLRPMLYAKLVAMAFLWSGVFPAVRIVLREMGIFGSVFVRFFAAALVLLSLLRLREGRWPRLAPREAGLVVALGLLGIALYNTLFTVGLGYVEASRAALIVPTNPAFTALFAALLLGERLNPLRAAGVALSVGGALWVLARGEVHAVLALGLGPGELALVACIFVWSAYTLLGRVALATVSPLALNAYSMLAAVVVLAPAAAWERAPLAAAGAGAWLAMAYLVVGGTVLPFLWYAEGVRALGAARAAQFINLVPPFAVAQAVLVFGEPWTPALGVGLALVAGGLYLTNRPRRS